MNISKSQTISLVILFLAIFVFAFYNTRSLRSGPVIKIHTPLPYSEVQGMVEVRGNVNKATELLVNNLNVNVTKEGDFVTNILLTPPYDDINIWAKNTYGKESFAKVSVLVKPDVIPEISTSTNSFQETLATSTLP